MYSPYAFNPNQFIPVQVPVPVPVPVVPIPLYDNRNGYTFREFLVNNGLPYDGRDIVTNNRNNLILDGLLQGDCDGHICPKRYGLGSCDHPVHRAQVSVGIPNRFTGRNECPIQRYCDCSCKSNLPKKGKHKSREKHTLKEKTRNYY